MRSARTAIDRERSRQYVEAANAWANSAIFRRALGQTDQALRGFERALGLAAVPSVQRVNILNNYSAAVQDAGMPDSAVTVAREAREIALSLGHQAGLGVALNNLGIAFHDLQNPDSALVLLDGASSLLLRSGDSLTNATVDANRGRVLQTVGRPDEALVYFARAIGTRRRTGDRPSEALVLSNIGYSHDLSRRPDSALAFYRESLRVAKSVCRPSFVGLAEMNVGRAHLALGQVDSARFYLERSLAAKKVVDDARGVGWALDNLGLALLRADSVDRAIAYHEEAAALLRGLGDRAREGTALYHLGAAHEASRLPDRAMKASAAYERASSALMGVRLRSGSDPHRLSFAEQYVDLYSRWALASLGRDDIPSEESRLVALAAAERGRAQALRDLLGDTTRSDQSDSLLVSGRVATALARINAEAALYYLVTADTLVTWLISRARPDTVVRVPVQKAAIEELIERARHAIDDSGGCDFFRERRRVGADTALLDLATLLIPDALFGLLPEAGELVIAPHGALNLLPFAALPTPTGVPLGIRYALRYTPSFEFLDSGEVQDLSVVASRSIVIGSPTMPLVHVCGQSFTPSAASRQASAGDSIARLLGTTLLSGDVATESALRQGVSDAPVIHFGSHGYAYQTDVDARRSFIALAPSEPEGDGRLTVEEILQWPSLSAELVVLGACQTGLGDLKEAEGTVGLQRAFLSRHARSVMASLWTISDRDTARLLQEFYREWLGGASKAEALRRAQAVLWREDSNPYGWAAFQLVGAR